MTKLAAWKRIAGLSLFCLIPAAGWGQRAPAPASPNLGVQAATTAEGAPTEKSSAEMSSAGTSRTEGPRIEGAPRGMSNLPPVVPAGRPAIGLVLEGGGALGLAHIGVLQWLEQNHIPVDRIAGTSMGALIGGLYASGRSAQQVEELAYKSDFTKVFTFETPYTDLSYRRRQDRRELPQGIQVGLKRGLTLRNALLTDRGLNGFLHENFSGYNSAELDFNRLPIPFRCVAADLNDLQMVVFAGGPMSTALRASISIPGLFSPVAYHGHHLVDGAIVDNLPTDVAKKDLDADVIVAVHLRSTAFSSSDIDSIVGVFTRAYSAGTARNERVSEHLADITIDVATEHFSTTDYSQVRQLIQAGYEAAEAQRAKLLKYALNDAAWAAYMADRNSRKHGRPGLFKALQLAGGSPGAQAEVRRDLAPLQGKPISQSKIFTALGDVQSGGSYDADFEIFHPEQHSSPNSPAAPGPDTGVLVRLTPARNGPPFLIVGGDITAANSNVTRGTLDLRLLDQDLGGFGSELRADLRLGFLTEASAEYYRLLTPTGFFLQPHLGILREPVYLWRNQVRIAEWLQQQAGGGLDFGRTFDRNMQLAAEWRDQIVRWHLALGPVTQPDLSGSSQTALLHFVYDDREAETISPRGIYLDLSAGALFHSVASQNAPLLQARADKAITLGEKNVFAVSVEGNTYFRRTVAQPLRFTLGGPLRLSASSINEYRGTDDYLVHGEYLRRLAALPSGLGQGLYLTLGYEAGEIWSPDVPVILRQDIVTGLVASTPVGVITFGGSVGDAGRRKIFFTLGRYF